jgi:hypothetical protein
MRYSLKAGVYRVVRVTGPHHNLLGLSFSECAPEQVALERLSGDSNGAIDEEELAQAVVSGVARANAAFGANYYVSRIQYVPGDTPAPEIYSDLAQLIVERIASGGAFEAG